MTDDRAQFEELFTRHYAAVVRYAVRRVGPDSAQEVVSETFLVAWRRLTEVPDNALPWLYATARRVVANELRRRGRSARLGGRVEAHAETVVPDHAELVTDRMRVRAVLDALPARDREVLRLTEWEGLGPVDGAAALGCSPAAFKVRLHRARRRFAAAIGEADVSHGVLITRGETT